jgi:DNA-binding XRE family transcriptional regulator
MGGFGLMTEWRQIGNTNYIASSDGRVARVLTPKRESNGYYTVCISRKKWRTTREYIHRLVMEAFHGASRLHVDHIDRGRSNNLVSNLRYVTQKENMSNAPVKRGAEHPANKLAECEVKAIRIMRGAMTQTRLAKIYGVSPSTIGDIQRRKIWKHL